MWLHKLTAESVLAHFSLHVPNLDNAAQKMDRFSIRLQARMVYMSSEDADCSIASVGGCYHNLANLHAYHIQMSYAAVEQHAAAC